MTVTFAVVFEHSDLLKYVSERSLLNLNVWATLNCGSNMELEVLGQQTRRGPAILIWVIVTFTLSIVCSTSGEWGS